MTFAEAAMIMMSGGKKPIIKPLSVSQNGPYNAADYGADGFDPVLVTVPSTPVSLEGFNSLKNVATVQIGTYMFEIKEPTLLYSGKMNVDITKDYDAGSWECGWHSAIVLNRTIAASGYNYIATEYRGWGDFLTSYGETYSEYYNTFSDFAVRHVDVYAQSNKLPVFYVEWSYTQTNGYVGGSPEISKSTASNTPASFYELSYPLVTNLPYDEYFQYIKTYLKTTSGAKPTVTIL